VVTTAYLVMNSDGSPVANLEIPLRRLLSYAKSVRERKRAHCTAKLSSYLFVTDGGFRRRCLELRLKLQSRHCPQATGQQREVSIR
jgi:hypothetical protein